MHSNKWLNAVPICRAAVLLAVVGACLPARSQDVSLAMLQPERAEAAAEPAALAPAWQPPIRLKKTGDHRFWSRENNVAFATSAAFSAVDFALTRDNLHNGGRELNPVTRMFSSTTTGLAMNFAGDTAGVIGLSYILHKMHHHKLEQAVSMVNIGASAAAVSFDAAHR
jgi:hypothetical protein